MVQFSGFSAEDFEAFSIPEFHDRMFYLRSQIRPKLAQLGDDVAPKLTVISHPLYPHTASHARRRVNPPDDTWVAFSRSVRGYKRYAHFEIGLDAEQVFVRLVVKPEGEDDKPALLRHLRAKGLDAFRQLNDPEPIYWYLDDHGHNPVPTATLTDDDLAGIIAETSKKSRGFGVGMVLSKQNPKVRSAQLVAQCVNMITHLSPLYRAIVAEDLVDVHG